MIEVTTTTNKIFDDQGTSVEVTVRVKNDSTLNIDETVTYEIKDFDIMKGNSLTREKALRLAQVLRAALEWDERRKVEAK